MARIDGRTFRFLGNWIRSQPETHRSLRPWWRRNGGGMPGLLGCALRGFPELESAGGTRYADIAVLAFSQTLAAHKLVADMDGTPLYFAKGNFSNGCTGTVDVICPGFSLPRRSDLCAGAVYHS
jgi:hypothetical protein